MSLEAPLRDSEGNLVGIGPDSEWAAKQRKEGAEKPMVDGVSKVEYDGEIDRWVVHTVKGTGHIMSCENFLKVIEAGRPLVDQRSKTDHVREFAGLVAEDIKRLEEHVARLADIYTDGLSVSVAE